ncbi:hypothetical protein [Rossellomorea aquimaris]|uniref:Uncharacterized protein n=1 Tax=Rossellomorea aquimaris TaxID=189382 RepID=A0A366EHE5_9BACI|nr:hypothetical protein [Rossellomorea aquimaris]RBP00855.1 hypothetical protein DET59_12457 [Rossellomorea aquimaris]
MKSIKTVTLCALILILLIGCKSNEENQVEVKMKSDEELKKITNTYTYEDYKRVFDEVISEAEELGKEDKLNKWVIRILAQEQLSYETDLTDEQVIQLAEKAMKEDKVWKTIAQEEYGISVTKEEVDNYIKEGPDTSELPRHLAYADALGLSLEELNHDFDHDIYEKNVIWLKLKPKLEDKYGITDNNKQVEKYEKEVKNQVH